MDGDKSGRWLLSDDRKVGGIFKDTRDKMREKGRKRKKRYVTFARELICDIYVYSIYLYGENENSRRELLEGSCKRGGYCIISVYGRSRTMFMRKTRG